MDTDQNKKGLRSSTSELKKPHFPMGFHTDELVFVTESTQRLLKQKCIFNYLLLSIALQIEAADSRELGGDLWATCEHLDCRKAELT